MPLVCQGYGFFFTSKMCLQPSKWNCLSENLYWSSARFIPLIKQLIPKTLVLHILRAAAMSPPDYMEIHVEDLLAQPEETLGQVSRFIDQSPWITN